MLDAIRQRTLELAVTLRKQAGNAAMRGFFEGLSAAARLHPRARPARHGVRVTRDVAYRGSGNPAHRLDVYRPTGEGPWPALLYVHGGGFRILSKDTHWLMGLGFARRGFVVFNIDYRLAPRHPFPAALIDAAAALRWVVERGAEHGADVGELVLAGESAGANLVTALTICCCYRRREPWARQLWQLGRVPRAVLPACGMLQVSDVARLARRRRLPTWVIDRLSSVSEGYLGESCASPGAQPLADPLLLLEQQLPPDRPLPPFFAAVGSRDPLLDDTRRLERALARVGASCEAHYFPGEVHAFHAFVWRPAARRCWREMYAFLDRTVNR